MNIFDRYIFKNLLIATVFVAAILAVVILLTQSLRFLELVIDSGASSGSFWMLTLLALPRFLEIIVPLALMAAILFVYNKMNTDSELVVIRSIGYAPAALARPAIILSIITTVFLLGVTMWGAPKSLASMQQMRQMIKAQFSTVLFREGVFNQIGKGLTVYVREHGQEGTLYGLMIYDSRKQQAATVLAKRGTLVATADGYQVLVYDGTRQEYDTAHQILKKLNFNRYTIDMPNSDPVSRRWQEPEERTIFELINPDYANYDDVANLRDFQIEIHRRFLSPLLAIVFTLIPCCALLLGSIERRGQARRIAATICIITLIQGLYISGFSLARQQDLGLVIMYGLVFIPLCVCGVLLSGLNENRSQRQHLGETP